MKTGSHKKTLKYSLAHRDDTMDALVAETDHRTLALWAIDCAGRVLHYFEEIFPDDPRPRAALNVCREWTTDGVFSMKTIRVASLAAHAAAREAGEDSPARSAARAAGQAVATAHVKTHAPGAARYAQQAVWRAAEPGEAEAAVTRERDWQVQHLCELIGQSAEIIR